MLKGRDSSEKQMWVEMHNPPTILDGVHATTVRVYLAEKIN